MRLAVALGVENIFSHCKKSLNDFFVCIGTATSVMGLSAVLVTIAVLFCSPISINNSSVFWAFSTTSVLPATVSCGLAGSVFGFIEGVCAVAPEELFAGSEATTAGLPKNRDTKIFHIS